VVVARGDWDELGRPFIIAPEIALLGFAAPARRRVAASRRVAVEHGGRASMTLPAGVSGRTTRLWREVADRVLVRRYPDFDVSIGLVIGDERALVIDTRGSDRQGRLLLDEVRWITHNKLVVANTHHHYDHVFGNVAFATAELWAHERCAVRLTEDAEETKLALAATMPEIAYEYTDTRVVPATNTFRDSVKIDLGGRKVDLTHFGRGHTDNDVVVVVPDAHILFAGDLVEQGGPPSFEDSYPMDWPGTLGRMLDLVDGPVVPGHGELVRRSFIEGQLADLSALSQLAARVRFDGGSAADALPLSPFPARAARVALRRAFAQLAGEV
jgi:glyoxylase-like metal-dependent hydrolase (beta-lactamase superfamily II)